MYREHNVSRRAMIAAAGLAGAAITGAAGCTAAEGVSAVGSASVQGVDTNPGLSAFPEPEPLTAAERKLATMTLDQKVAQLFFVTPEQLTGVGTATVAGDATRDALARMPVGGLIYFAKNFTGAQQVRDLISGTRALGAVAGAGIPPFLGVDEEGGSLVARIANSGLFNVTRFPNMADIGATGDPGRAAEVGRTIGAYLADIGFSVDFAPVADVLTNPANTVIGRRAFGSDATLVSNMVAAEVEAMLPCRVLPCAKHFPGHGDTAGDSHTGAVLTNRSRDQIESCELAPFRAAIAAGCPFIMAGHIETPNFAADGLPASVSPTMLTGVLREELGFTGVIITDSFSMGAITQHFGPADAACRFIEAGGDMVLMPADLNAAYEGIRSAVASGRITEGRINESVLRILSAKETAGLIS